MSTLSLSSLQSAVSVLGGSAFVYLGTLSTTHGNARVTPAGDRFCLNITGDSDPYFISFVDVAARILSGICPVSGCGRPRNHLPDFVNCTFHNAQCDNCYAAGARVPCTTCHMAVYCDDTCRRSALVNHSCV